MNIVIANTSRLRVAVNKIAKNKNESSMTSLLTKNGISCSLFSKAERRFEQYRSMVKFDIDDFTMYGAIYEDTWQQLIDSLEINEKDFEMETIPAITNVPSALKAVVNTELENRIFTLEKKVSELEKKISDYKRMLSYHALHLVFPLLLCFLQKVFSPSALLPVCQDMVETLLSEP